MLEEKKTQYQYIEGISAPLLLLAAPPLPILKPIHFNLTISKPLPQTQIAAGPEPAASSRRCNTTKSRYTRAPCCASSWKKRTRTTRRGCSPPTRTSARARIWTDFVTSRIIPAFHRFLQYQPACGGAEGLQKAREKFLGYLKEFTAEMDAEGPYFLDRELSLIDIAIVPWAVRLWVFDHFKEGGVA